MRRRIRGAIVGVSAIIILALGVPLAVVVHQSVLDREVVELQATAATALAEIDVPLSRAQLVTFSGESDAPDRFGVYDPSGKKVYGLGPATADRVVDKARRGKTASTIDSEIVVATPIVETGSERVRGVLRVSESLADADQRSRTAWLVMAVAGLAALGLAWLIGNRLARILADPLSDLAERAATIGEGVGPEPRTRSGIGEIDELASVLAQRARRVHEALQRERQFSADVSHQLRTPITALRLKLESQGTHPLDGSDLEGALNDLDRLETTIGHLLAVAREQVPTGGDISLDEAVVAAVERWTPRASAAGRALGSAPAEPTTVRAHRTSIDEVLDVLIDNGIGHGTGAITVSIRRIVGGVAVDVADEGESIGLLDAARVFTRGHGTGDGEGIGLGVARSIAEAEGARLVLTRHRPTTFSLLLLEEPQAPVVPGASGDGPAAREP